MSALISSQQRKIHEAPKAEKRATDQKTIELTDKIAEFTGYLVIAAIVQAGIFALQLYVFGLQARRLRETVDATNESVGLARKEFAITHRPKIHIRHVHFARWLVVGQPVKVTIVSVNSGDSDARVIEFDAVTHLVPVNRHLPQAPFEGRSPISPMQVLPSGVALEVQAESGALDKGALKDLSAKTHRLFCFAYFDYLDTSDESPRRTSCCRVFVPDHYEWVGSVLKGHFAEFESEHEYED